MPATNAGLPRKASSSFLMQILTVPRDKQGQQYASFISLYYLDVYGCASATGISAPKRLTDVEHKWQKNELNEKLFGAEIFILCSIYWISKQWFFGRHWFRQVVGTWVLLLSWKTVKSIVPFINRLPFVNRDKISDRLKWR